MLNRVSTHGNDLDVSTLQTLRILTFRGRAYKVEGRKCVGLRAMASGVPDSGIVLDDGTEDALGVYELEFQSIRGK